MKKPILVIMAAGMGSRYGGLKQIDPVGPSSEVILDYSVFDAKRAGFETVVFIIKDEIADQFKSEVGDKIAEHMEVRYAYQELYKLPEGYDIPEGRVKPWGTSHAILSAKDVIDAPFAVINADDFYGQDAFKQIYDFLAEQDTTQDNLELAMVGYLLKNTVSENGHVSRGVCQVSDDNKLLNIDERKQIEIKEDGIYFTLDKGETWEKLNDNDIVSMNLWGYNETFIKELEKRFPAFLDEAMVSDPLKGEYLLPDVVKVLLAENKGSVEVLQTSSKWYGITYKEDKEKVVAAIRAMVDAGEYPEKLWS